VAAAGATVAGVSDHAAVDAAPGGPGAARPALRRGVSVERTWLDEGSWVDVVRGWVEGAESLYDTLVAEVTWSRSRLFRYERWVEQNYEAASYRLAEPLPDPVLRDATRALRARYKVGFDGFSLIRYRDQRSSMAFHRDTDLRWLDDTVIALLVLGARRPFLLRPRANRHAHGLPAKGATHDLAPGHGDLVVMGGRCQQGWEHCVPAVDHPLGGRVSVQWRWTSGTGRPFAGSSYRAPLYFDR
jgi:alkylated DNA repair dioxygenase AlkB